MAGSPKRMQVVADTDAVDARFGVLIVCPTPVYYNAPEARGLSFRPRWWRLGTAQILEKVGRDHSRLQAETELCPPSQTAGFELKNNGACYVGGPAT